MTGQEPLRPPRLASPGVRGESQEGVLPQTVKPRWRRTSFFTMNSVCSTVTR